MTTGISQCGPHFRPGEIVDPDALSGLRVWGEVAELGEHLTTIIDPAQIAELNKKAREVASFLAWAADPRAQERKSLGYYVIGYLIIFTTMLYFLKGIIWARLDKV